MPHTVWVGLVLDIFEITIKQTICLAKNSSPLHGELFKIEPLFIFESPVIARNPKNVTTKADMEFGIPDA